MKFGVKESDRDALHGSQQVMIPVIEEQLQVAKKLVTTGIVHLQKHAEQHVETMSVLLTDVRWDVQHVAVGRVVAEAPPIRNEGETTIYPVMEERLVVTRELVLKEEVHVTRVSEIRTQTSSHTLVRETVEEERTSLRP